MKKERQDRISELAEYIACQEATLNAGAKGLQELNDQYNELDREYKALLSRRRELLDEITTLVENLDLYSNL
jgi:septal ring factor EnvC (AmiA/AmiB activator)